MKFLIAIRSELIKIKRSAVLYFCLIAAAIVPTVSLFEVLSASDGAASPTPMSLEQYFRMAQQIFNFIFLPIFIILTSTLLSQIEFRNNTWKQVLTSPQKRINLFLAKYCTLVLVILLFIATFSTLLLLNMGIIKASKPELLTGHYELSRLMSANFNSFVSILAISAFQFWLSLRFKNFIIPMAIGFVLWIMGPLMLFTLKWTFAYQYPYVFPLLLSELSEMNSIIKKVDLQMVQILSICYAAVFLALGFIDFKHRRLKIS